MAWKEVLVMTLFLTLFLDPFLTLFFRMGVDVIDYFKSLAEETGVPYQNLINSYLRDCVVLHKKPSLKWAS
jgi:hypothetical protein